MTDRRTLQALADAPWNYEETRWHPEPLPSDGTDLWSMWGGQKVWTVGAGGTPVPDTQEIEIARIEAPSPRAIRLTLQLIAQGSDAVTFTIRCGVGRIELARVVTLTGSDTTDLEVAARFIRVRVELLPPILNQPVTALAVIAPVVPWL